MYSLDLVFHLRVQEKIAGHAWFSTKPCTTILVPFADQIPHSFIKKISRIKWSPQLLTFLSISHPICDDVILNPRIRRRFPKRPDFFDFFYFGSARLNFFESTSRTSVIRLAIPPGQFENYVLLPTLLHVVEPSLSRWPLPVCLLLKSPFGPFDLSQPIFLNAENQREFAGYPRLFGPIWSLACLAELGTDQHHGVSDLHKDTFIRKCRGPAQLGTVQILYFKQ